MSEPLLEDVSAAKQKAMVLRNRGRHDEALNTLDGIIDGLKARAHAAKDDARALAAIDAELADAYGMRGGVNRRRDKPAEALADYRIGLEYERHDADRKSSYNLGNVIALQIVAGTKPDDPSLAGEIDEAIASLQRQTAPGGERSDEWWAWADLGQFRLLRGDLAGAREAYQEGRRRSGPKASEIKRHFDVLRELMAAIEPVPGRLTQAVQEYSEMVSALA